LLLLENALILHKDFLIAQTPMFNNMKKLGNVLILFIILLATSCTTHYQMAGIERTRILIDQRFDKEPDAAATQFIKPYKQKVDSIMSPVVGQAAHYMSAGKPESDLSNLLSDIFVWGGKMYNEHPDFAVYNMGGIRASLAKGTVTYGDIVDVAPFENKICFLTLSGEKVLQLFSEIARTGGEGVSHGVKLVITKDGKLKSALLNGQPVNPKRSYRVATLDFVAQGNDHMEAFKAKTDIHSPQDEKSNSRYIICQYFKEMSAQGKAVDAKVEGRIVIE
jgi:2',3'-cyclic-nucleotide 2'-phosphodiesterase (5'-nucleotidase family)